MIWKETKYKQYLVSDTGQVKRSGKILKQGIGNHGYSHVKFCISGIISANQLIHRLVAEAFIANPENKAQVNHKDGNKQNNCASNLEWTTPSENQKHAHSTGLGNPAWKGVFGKKHPRSKKVVQLLDGKIIKTWDSMQDAGRAGFSSAHISRCCTGERKSHSGFQWNFI